LPLFVAICCPGFAVDFSSSQSLGDGVSEKIKASAAFYFKQHCQQPLELLNPSK
jgi:hypothetical protein